MTKKEHKFVLALQTEEFAEWQCPACPRRIRLGKRGLQILNPGQQLINHGTAVTGGLSISSHVEHPTAIEPWRSDSNADSEAWRSEDPTDAEPWRSESSNDTEPWLDRLN